MAKDQTIRIYWKHHNDPEGKFQPKSGSCQDWTDPRGTLHKGCGGAVIRYVTYPNEKGIRFDAVPDVVGDLVVLTNGAVIATVKTDQVHFATCPQQRRKDPPVRDFKAATAGGAQ